MNPGLPISPLRLQTSSPMAVPGRGSVSHLAPSSQASSSCKLPDADRGKEGRCGHHPITALQAPGSELMSGLRMVTGACGTAEGEGHELAAGTDKAEGGRPVPGEQDSTDRVWMRWEAPEGGQRGGAARGPGGRDLFRCPSSQPAPVPAEVGAVPTLLLPQTVRRTWFGKSK